MAVATGLARELRHRLLRQGDQPDARDVLARKLAEDGSERVARRQLIVAIGSDEQAPGVLNAAAHEPDEVEGQLVRPVKVFEHHDAERIWRRQPGEQLGKQPLARDGRRSGA